MTNKLQQRNNTTIPLIDIYLGLTYLIPRINYHSHTRIYIIENDMPDTSIGQLFVAALGGGTTVKLIDILYQEFKAKTVKKQSAASFVDDHLGPLLKSADELVGKIRSLASNDFRDISGILANETPLRNADLGGLAFLFCRFWAQIEIIRREGISISFGKDERGVKLQQFLDCIESKPVRIVPRMLQRAAGEAALHEGNVSSYISFVHMFESDEEKRRWITPLILFLTRLKNRSERQKILEYFVILHAFIDTFDPDHLITHKRPGLSRKLTKETRHDLSYRVFPVYLKFVADRQKYIGPP